MSLPPGSLGSMGDAAWLERIQAHFNLHPPKGSGAAEIELLEVGAYLKFSFIQGKHRLRHALRCMLPAQQIPRLQEYSNLEWLRNNEFGAPRPLAAGVVHRGLPVFQFLATELVPGTRDLRALEPRTHSSLPADLFRTLGREIARMHNLGFIHRDLYPRNILMRSQGAQSELFFLDAWRGGLGRDLRGPDYDLACLLLFAPLLFSTEQTARFLESYFESDLIGSNPKRIQRITHLRKLLQRQLINKGRRRHALPPEKWSLPI
jgi:tRNA A-37 threonylcarbamoyl transferase component Bud32